MGSRIIEEGAGTGNCCIKERTTIETAGDSSAIKNFFDNTSANCVKSGDSTNSKKIPRECPNGRYD